VQGSVPSEKATRYLGNTNLEQVSDWLTKIIVGVGLVQIGRIVPALSKLAESMKAPLGRAAVKRSFRLGADNHLRFARLFLLLFLESRAIATRVGGLYSSAAGWYKRLSQID
jgi:hypothetical protein